MRREPSRRRAIKRAMLLAVGAIMGKFDSVQAKESEALLTVDLSQWRGVRFTHKGKTVIVPVAEVFDAVMGIE